MVGKGISAELRWWDVMVWWWVSGIEAVGNIDSFIELFVFTEDFKSKHSRLIIGFRDIVRVLFDVWLFVTYNKSPLIRSRDNTPHKTGSIGTPSCMCVK